MELNLSAPKAEVNRTVVRVTHSHWQDGRGGLNFTVKVKTLQRKSCGHNLLEEDVSFDCAQNTLERIENLTEVPPGIYEVKVVNQSRDWETGYIDDWDYKLVPYKEEDDG